MELKQLTRIADEPARKAIRFTNKATSSDIQAILLGKLGFSYRAIAAQTNLSVGQVASRLRFAQVSVKQYRNGETQFAKQVMEVAETHGDRYFEELKGELRRLKDEFSIEDTKEGK